MGAESRKKCARRDWKIEALLPTKLFDRSDVELGMSCYKIHETILNL